MSGLTVSSPPDRRFHRTGIFKNQRMIFLALKTEDGRITGEYSGAFSITSPVIGKRYSGQTEITVPGQEIIFQSLIIEAYIARCKSIIRRSQDNDQVP